MLPVAEVGRRLAVRVVDLVDDRADVHRVGRESPVVLDGHLDAHLAAEVGHLPVRLDGGLEQRDEVDVARIAVAGSARHGVGPDARPERLRRVHPHRLDAEHLAALEPALGQFHAGLAARVGLGRAVVGQAVGRVVGDVLHVGAGLDAGVGQRVEPLPARRAHRVEAAWSAVGARREEHRVVGDVAEEPREQVHAGHARERVLRELREVQHGDLAVLLLHLGGARQVRAGGRGRPGDLEGARRVRVGLDLLQRGLSRGGTVAPTCAARPARRAGGTTGGRRARRTRRHRAAA